MDYFDELFKKGIVLGLSSLRVFKVSKIGLLSIIWWLLVLTGFSNDDFLTFSLIVICLD